MAATCVFSFVFVICVVTSANSTALKWRNKREILSSGWLASPGYGMSNYPNNCKQDFVIQTDATRPCVVTIRYVADIEWSSGCVYDRLIINVGKSDQRYVCGSTNGQIVTYSTTVSDGSGVAISFRSDQTQNAKGYHLEYTVQAQEPYIDVYSNTGGTAPEGRIVEGRQSTGNYASERWGNTGSFASPNYPNTYPGNYDGNFVAHLDTNGPQTVRVHYKYDIELQENCLFDYLEYANTGQRVCGVAEGTVDIPVQGNTFELRFHSDNSDNRQGFTLSYEVLGAVPQFSSRSLSLSSLQASNTTNATSEATISTSDASNATSDVGVATSGSSDGTSELTVLTNATEDLANGTSEQMNATSGSTSASGVPIAELTLVKSESGQNGETTIQEDFNILVAGECELCAWTRYGDADYSFNHHAMTFDDAVTACARCGGHMVTAKDQDRFELVRTIVSQLSGKDSFWLGATDRDTEGQWVWLDGTPFTFTLWKRHEPDNADGDNVDVNCLAVTGRGEWKDQECAHPRKSLCTRPLGTMVLPGEMCAGTNSSELSLSSLSTATPTQLAQETTALSVESNIQESLSLTSTLEAPESALPLDQVAYQAIELTSTFSELSSLAPLSTLVAFESLNVGPGYEFSQTSSESLSEASSDINGFSLSQSQSPGIGFSDDITVSASFSSVQTSSAYLVETPVLMSEPTVYDAERTASFLPSFSSSVLSVDSSSEFFQSSLYSASDPVDTEQYGTQNAANDEVANPSSVSDVQNLAGTEESCNFGYITSPKYPDHYPSYQDYDVTVSLDQPGPRNVTLTLQDFDVVWSFWCIFDYVIINNDASNKLCGNKSGDVINVQIPEGQQTLTVTLHTDGFFQGRGFNITYCL